VSAHRFGIIEAFAAMYDYIVMPVICSSISWDADCAVVIAQGVDADREFGCWSLGSVPWD
jgi:hypothetical protein